MSQPLRSPPRSRASMGAQELSLRVFGMPSRPAFSGLYVLPHCTGQATYPEGHIHNLSSLQVCGLWPQQLSISSLPSQHLWSSLRDGSGVYAPRRPLTFPSPCDVVLLDWLPVFLSLSCRKAFLSVATVGAWFERDRQLFVGLHLLIAACLSRNLPFRRCGLTIGLV
jgi:hypothetical protein